MSMFVLLCVGFSLLLECFFPSGFFFQFIRFFAGSKNGRTDNDFQVNYSFVWCMHGIMCRLRTVLSQTHTY